MRLFLVLGTFVLLALSVTAVTAVGASQQNVAKANISNPCDQLDFNATSNINGTDPSGTMTHTFPCNDPNTVFKGAVDCMIVTRDPVTGNGRATIAGHYTSVRNGVLNPANTTGWIIVAEDNRASGSSSGNPDRYRFFGTGPFAGVFDPVTGDFTPVPFPTCTPPPLATNPVVKGDIYIKDANVF
jgi:HAMP domain-containing protein